MIREGSIIQLRFSNERRDVDIYMCDEELVKQNCK
jgi:hypothetical protein